MSLCNLPIELTETIAFCIVDRKDLSNLRLVSKRYYKIITPLLRRNHVVRVQYSLISRLHASVLSSSSLSRCITGLELLRDPWPRPGAVWKPSLGRRFSAFFPTLGVLYERFLSWRRDDIRSSNLCRVLPSLPYLRSMRIPTLEDLGEATFNIQKGCPECLLRVQELHLTGVWEIKFSQVFWCMTQMPNLRILNVHRIRYSQDNLAPVGQDTSCKITHLTLRLSTYTDLCIKSLFIVLGISKNLQSLTLVNYGSISLLTLSGILKKISNSQANLKLLHLSRITTTPFWDEDQTKFLLPSFTALRTLHLPYYCVLRAIGGLRSLEDLLPANLRTLRLGGFTSIGSIEEGTSVLQNIIRCSPTLEVIQLQVLLPRQNLIEMLGKELTPARVLSVETPLSKAWYVVLVLGNFAHTVDIMTLPAISAGQPPNTGHSPSLTRASRLPDQSLTNQCLSEEYLQIASFVSVS